MYGRIYRQQSASQLGYLIVVYRNYDDLFLHVQLLKIMYKNSLYNYLIKSLKYLGKVCEDKISRILINRLLNEEVIVKISYAR